MKASRGNLIWALMLAAAAAGVLAGGGCAEKIAGTDSATEMIVSLDLKAGPAVSFRLTVSAADMDTVTSLMAPTENRVVAILEIPIGPDRHFLVEGLDLLGEVLYRGETVQDVNTLLPLDLTIPMEPIVPLIYLNPHFAEIELGSDFSITVNVNELPTLFRAGIGLSLFGFDQYKLAEIAVIDTVLLAPGQIERGSELSYFLTGSDEVYFTVDNSMNEAPIVDAEGDAELVIIRCRSQDTWPGEPVAIVPQLFVEVLDSFEPAEDALSLDSARYLLVRSRAPESFLGDIADDRGAALVNLGGGEFGLAGDTADLANDGVPQLLLARLGADRQPVWTTTHPWPISANTTGLARAVGGGFFVSGTTAFNAGSVVRLNDLGAEIWRQDLANLGNGSPFAIASRPGGGSVAAGSWPNDGLHFYLAVFDDAGYRTHFETTDFSADQEYRSVVALDDNTFVAAGYEQPFSDSSDAIIARYSLGAELTRDWSRNLGGPGDERAFDLLALDGGGFLVVGAADTLNSGSSDLFVTRTDSDGFPVWSRYFGVPGVDEVALSVTPAPGGTFVAAGYSAALRTNRDVYVVRFNGNGDLIWENTLGGPADDLVEDIVSASNGFVATGSTDPGPLGQRDILLLRLDGNGEKVAD